MNTKPIVFCGGTCNGSKWRDKLIPLLKIDYFDPVVENWTPECQQKEIEARGASDFVLYVLTPKMTGFFCVAEATDDSNKRPAKTVLCVLEEDEGEIFSEHQLKSIKAIKKMVESNGAKVCGNLEEVAQFVNNS